MQLPSPRYRLPARGGRRERASLHTIAIALARLFFHQNSRSLRRKGLKTSLLSHQTQYINFMLLKTLSWPETLAVDDSEWPQ